MANKGGSNRNKRRALPVARQVLRKTYTWALRPTPGPHSKETVLPLGEIIREKLGLASNRKEIKAILNSGNVLVDGKLRKEAKFPVGLFDVIKLEAEKKQFRVVFDRKGRLQLQEMDAKEAPLKVVKVVRKKMLGKNAVQLTANDGKTFTEKDPKARVGDSLVIELPENKVAEQLELKEGQLVYLMAGNHVGKIATVQKLVPGTMQKKALAELSAKEGDFQTITDNLLVLGNKKPAILVTEEKTEHE